MSRAQYRQIALEAAQRHGINPRLFMRQMRQEAHFQDLTSGAGAQGPAQIMPATAAAWGVRNVHDPHEAYNAAAEHMASYLHSYGGSWAKALTAYNAGPGRVGGPLPDETKHYIQTILGGAGHHNEHYSLQPAITFGGAVQATAPKLNPGGTTTDNKAAMLAAVMDHRKGMSLMDRFHEAISSGNYTTTTAPSVTPGKVTSSFGPVGSTPGATVPLPAGKGGATGRLARVTATANRIDAAHVPYLWGGGHQALQVPRNAKVTPLDCSGAVSRVLGINPRVASQFKTWGKPGRGKAITVWAKNDHVIVEIGGQFWGTSAANPGGGAGWIPRSQISSSYLAQFTPRHPG